MYIKRNGEIITKLGDFGEAKKISIESNYDNIVLGTN